MRRLFLSSSKNYLVGEGFAFEFVVVVVVELVFDLVMFVFDGAVVPVFDGAVVVVEVVFDTVVDPEFAFMVFAGFALALFVAVSPPHAAPNAAKPKSAESAIAFFM